MESLEKMRENISRIDREMARLFEERMLQAGKIGEYKKAFGLPVLDTQREKELISNNLSLVAPENRDSYLPFFNTVLSLSKERQNGIINENSVYVSLPEGGYPVHFTSLSEADRVFSLKRKCLIVTDENIPREYTDTLSEKCLYPFVHILKGGEENKNIDSVLSVTDSLFKNGFDRTDCVIALGGGVTGDIASFAASVYMRGIDFYNVPTSLIAMADSSVGGKTGVNQSGIKNLIGTFYQPKAVLTDTELLKTLPEREMKNGIAEVIKTAAIGDTELFSLLEKTDVSADISCAVKRCVRVKADIVSRDVNEKDIRRLLNFGHTAGHAFEISGTGLLHGECVGIGMVYMSQGEARERITGVLKKYGLPVSLDGLREIPIKKILHDKKSEGDFITVVYMKEIGKPVLVRRKKEELLKLFEEVR